MATPPSRAAILGLYTSTLRASRSFSSYNFREYFLRRTRETFRAMQAESDPNRVGAMYADAVKELGVLRRSAIVNQLYGGWKLAVEDGDKLVMQQQQPLTRRLSSRRGSATAADPHATHATLSHTVQASSTLTIVRVTSPPPQPDPPAPSSPRRSHHRPHPPDRVSFAVSSFRPASPTSPHRPTQNLPSVPRLSPNQLVDLARSSTHHRPLQSVAPATFTPLPDDILLPFIDRPSEVAALISTPPSARLFSLLQKTLAPVTEPSPDPSMWSYTQLHQHLTQVSRHEANDAIWVLQARRCIISHSELIWERVKGALGVPPELDVDYHPSDPDSAEFETSSVCSIDTDEISDDHGRSARGHWEDWDAVMDSPVYARTHSAPGSPVLPFSLTKKEDQQASRDSAIFDHRPASPSTFLSIEPLLASSSPPHIPSNYSSSEIGGLGLDDIQEGAEEEEEESTATPDENQHEPLNQEAHDPHLIAPSQIQGLRITTTPVSLSDLSTPALPISSSLSPVVGSASASLSKPLSPISPLPPYNYPPASPRPPSGPFVRPQLAGYGPGGPPPVFRRSGSFGSLTGAVGDHGQGDHDRYPSSVSAGSDSASGYIRAPGSPLFPSSFARLSSIEPHAHG
ncbi:hypothetical protein C0995_014583 [Termitomyces sp. Mi166|nr:hypothetical protein C0995_014583 [Termitomyces sp. Mi166\